jgi:hypothetical protein
MTINLDYYRKINGLYGTTDKKDFLTKQIVKSINKSHSHILSTFEILINSNIAENIIADGISTKCVFDYSRETEETKSQLANYDKEMWIEANTINVGSIIKHTDKISGIENIYIVMVKEESDRGYDIAYIQKTNNFLKFYKTNILCTVPYCLDNSNSLNTDENKFITEAITKVNIIIPKNETTLQIKRGDIFKLGDIDNYKVIDYLRIKDGLIELKMEYCLEQPVIHTYRVEITNGDILQISQSQLLSLNTIVYQDDVALTTSPPLVFSSSDVNIATINTSGIVTILGLGTVIFTVNLESDTTITDTISVEIIADETHNYTYDLVGNISPDTEIKTNISKIYTAHKYDNGALVEDAEFVFEIIAGDTPSNKYLFTVLDSKSCSLKALGYLYYVIIRATDTSNNQFVDKVIKLRSSI